eukprot:GHVR01009442.1.p1 GENE.GHVR01009442.1~~GHVR01009442.1.p1  ORF type:complete len:536 (+),score=265.61 GHVR01009442.1:68-1609(+)
MSGIGYAYCVPPMHMLNKTHTRFMLLDRRDRVEEEKLEKLKKLNIINNINNDDNINENNINENNINENNINENNINENNINENKTVNRSVNMLGRNISEPDIYSRQALLLMRDDIDTAASAQRRPSNNWVLTSTGIPVRSPKAVRKLKKINKELLSFNQHTNQNNNNNDENIPSHTYKYSIRQSEALIAQSKPSLVPTLQRNASFEKITHTDMSFPEPTSRGETPRLLVPYVEENRDVVGIGGMSPIASHISHTHTNNTHNLLSSQNDNIIGSRDIINNNNISTYEVSETLKTPQQPPTPICSSELQLVALALEQQFKRALAMSQPFNDPSDIDSDINTLAQLRKDNTTLKELLRETKKQQHFADKELNQLKEKMKEKTQTRYVHSHSHTTYVIPSSPMKSVYVPVYVQNTPTNININNTHTHTPINTHTHTPQNKITQYSPPTSTFVNTPVAPYGHTHTHTHTHTPRYAPSTPQSVTPHPHPHTYTTTPPTYATTPVTHTHTHTHTHTQIRY